MNSDTIHNTFKFACKLVESVGEYVRSATESRTSTQNKECYADLVTEYDQKTEDMLVSQLKSEYPSHKFIAEEMTTDNGSHQFLDDPTWIIDPIDGTTNFVHSYPSFAISVGFYINQQPVFGIVYEIANNNMFTAIKGEGAFCNGRVLSCSSTKDLQQALIGTEFGSQRDEAFLQFKIDMMSRLVRKCHGLRGSGAATLQICHVAAGHLDAYYEFGPHIWDFAAAQLIASEAGAVISSPNGKPFNLRARKILVACCAELANQITPLIDDFDVEHD